MAAFFDNFPVILYGLPMNTSDPDTFFTIKDLSLNIRFRKDFLNNIQLFEYYYCKDGETPSILAEKFYGNPYYDWVIMLFNEKFDVINDFPLSTEELEVYITSVYGEDHWTDVHHYEDANGLICDETTPGRTAVTNYEYENNLNEAKRKLKVLHPNLLNSIIQQLNAII